MARSFAGYPLSRILPRILPPVFLPAITSINVVLPAPEDPMSAVMVPGLAIPETPCSRSMSSPFLPPGMGTEYQRSCKAKVTGTTLAVDLVSLKGAGATLLVFFLALSFSTTIVVSRRSVCTQERGTLP
ncbi:unnamed protein product [Phytophthora lilii]|uniref:Unnamed protein product n=1 Tax=Phytophthora lilii TaxID=2077276 RepID=A0A9W6WTH9_9STRA|nr:unnamed protein product [Phytophthora lilii]